MAASIENGLRAATSRRLIWCVTVVVLVGLAVGGVFAWRWSEDRARRQEALRLADQGQFDVAEPALRELAARRPDDAEVAHALAVGYLGAHKAAEAEEFLDRWCALQPGDPNPYRRRAEFRKEQQRMGPALEDVDHALTLVPGDAYLHRLRARLLLLSARHDEAEQECLGCLRTDPGNVDLWYLLAGIYQRQGRIAEATPLADRFLEAQPNLPNALLLRAELYLAAEKPEPAIPLLLRAAEKPGALQVEVFHQLAQAYTLTHQDNEARKARAEMQWRQAVGVWSKDSHRDTNGELQERVVTAMLEADKVDAAISFLAEILRRNPGAASAHRLLATCYEKKGRPELAAEHRRRAGATP